MAVGATVQKISNVHELIKDEWENSAAGKYMWVLATKDYTALKNDVGMDAVGADHISAGDGAPIAVTGKVVTKFGDALEADPKGAYLDCDDANFGTTVTVTAKWLLLVKVDTPNVVTTTSADIIMLHIDLNTDGPTDELVVVADYLKFKMAELGLGKITHI